MSSLRAWRCDAEAGRRAISMAAGHTFAKPSADKPAAPPRGHTERRARDDNGGARCAGSVRLRVSVPRVLLTVCRHRVGAPTKAAVRDAVEK
jgi:hypothetical protein